VTYYVLLLFFVFEYLRPGAYVPGLDGLHLNALIPLTCIIGTVVAKTPVSHRQFLAEWNTKIIGALLGLLVVSTMFALVTMTAFSVTRIVFAYMLIYWVLVRQVGDLRRLRGVFITLTLVHITIAALNPAVFTSTESRVGVDSGAFLGDGNDFSLSVNICIPLCLFLMAESKKKIVKAVWAGALLALVLCVIATQSRGGTIALAAVGLYYWLKSPRKLQTAALFVLMLAFVLVWAPASYFDRMGMIDSQESSAQGRIIAWKAAVQMALANPLLGGGAGHFPIMYGNFYHVEGTPWLTAHSIYFLLLGELGVPGIALLLTFIFGNLAANRRMLRQIGQLPPGQASTAKNVLACTSAALVAFATAGAFLSAAYYPHMYVLAGMLAAARHAVRVQLEAREQTGHDPALDTQPAGPTLRPAGISPDWRPRPAITAGRRHFV
jgi:probable O-glycosylation ligase (exosortase A-associated)